MTENPALYAAIVAHPREDTPRLAYADWLDENGDPDRARFIRLQYEIERLPPVGAKVSKAKKEEEALLKKHEMKWAGEIAQLVDLVRFRRGFVEWVRVTVEQFLRHAGRLFELAPIREVRFEHIDDRMAELVASPHFGRAETLAFSPTCTAQLGLNDRLAVLLGAPTLMAVRRLDLGMNYLNRTHAEQIARCPYLGALVYLNLSSNFIGADGLRAVAHSDGLPALMSLDLFGGSQVGLGGVRMLVDSPLSLACNRMGDEGAKTVADAARLKGLLTLDLSNNITAVGFDALIASPHLTRLQRLTLRQHTRTLTKDMRERLKKRFGKDVCVF